MIFYCFLPTLAVTILVSLLPVFANIYKGLVLDSRLNELNAQTKKTKKIDFLNEKIKGCSLFTINKELFNKQDSLYDSGYRYSGTVKNEVILSTSTNTEDTPNLVN